MIHIYRYYKMCVLLSLFMETSLVTPMAWLLFRTSGISLFFPFVLSVMDVFLLPYIELSTSDKYTRKFQKIR